MGLMQLTDVEDTPGFDPRNLTVDMSIETLVNNIGEAQFCRTEQEDCQLARLQYHSSTGLIKQHHSLENLQRLLNIIETNCASAGKQAKQLCSGSMVALYYFNGPAYDDVILNRFRQLPIDVQNNIFNQSFQWYQNRSNSRAWVDYLMQAPIDYSKMDKPGLVTLFNQQGKK